LPKLADLHSGIYIREGGPQAAYQHLADEIIEALNPPVAATARLVSGRGRARDG
jgi:hypothetical protein